MWEAKNNVRTVTRRHRCRDINENDFEIDTRSRDKLQGVKKQDPDLNDEGKLVAQELPRTSGKEQVDGSLHHKHTVDTTIEEAAIFDCGHEVLDSANETKYW